MKGKIIMPLKIIMADSSENKMKNKQRLRPAEAERRSHQQLVTPLDLPLASWILVCWKNNRLFH